MLSEKDVLDYKKGIREIFEILGTNAILYHPLDINSANSIYREKKGVTYLPPITLIGGLKVDTSDSKPFKDTNNYSVDITISIPVLELENHNLKPNEMTSGLFEYKNNKYEILFANPQGLFSDIFSTYDFTCREVNVI